MLASRRQTAGSPKNAVANTRDQSSKAPGNIFYYSAALRHEKQVTHAEDELPIRTDSDRIGKQLPRQTTSNEEFGRTRRDVIPNRNILASGRFPASGRFDLKIVSPFNQKVPELAGPICRQGRTVIRCHTLVDIAFLRRTGPNATCAAVHKVFW